MTPPRTLLTVALVLAAAPAARADDFSFTEFTAGMTPNASPASVGLGPDGNVWMGEIQGAGRIARVTPAGVVTELTGGVTPGLTFGRAPANVAAGPDGNVWVTEFADPGAVAKVTPAGAVTEYPAPGNPTGITLGPDGDLWFVGYANPGRIAKITTDGEVSTVATGGTNFTANSQPRGIALGSDGNLWFTEFAGPGRIGRVTPAGVVTEFTGGVAPGFSEGSQPVAITPGPDGNLWFTEQGAGGRIGRITPAGVVTEFALAPGRQPVGITPGPDGALWFTEQASPGGVGRITTGGQITEFVAGHTPGFTANRAPLGITTGADGSVWFSESADPGAIVRISGLTPAPTATATPATPAATPSATPPASPLLPPHVTAVVSGGPVVAGSPALLSAQVQGSAQHLDWDLNGDGKPEVSCPGDKTTLRFRPGTGARASAGFSGRVSVTAVGAGGAAGPALTQSLTVAPAAPLAASQTLKDAVARVVERQPPVYACGTGPDFGVAQGEQTKCLGWTIHAGTLNVTGCLLPVHQLSQIPAAERGIVQALARSVGIKSTGPSSTLKIPEFVMGQFDGWVATGPVLINGVELKPAGKASIVVYTQVDQIVSSDAAMTVGGIALDHKTEFSLNTRPATGNTIPLGKFPRLPGRISGLGAFPMDGELGVTLDPAAPGAQAGAEITTVLKLPSFLNFGYGDPAMARVTLKVTADGRLVLEDMHIRLPDVWLGALEMHDLALDFAHEGADSVWRGHGKLCITEVVCIDALARPGETPPGGVVIRNGEFEYGFARFAFPEPGIQLYPNVFLANIGAGVGTNPSRVFGSAVVNAMQIYRLDGRLVMAFPSAADPYVLNEGEMGGLTDKDYGNKFSEFMFAASGSASLAIDPLGISVPLGSAYLVYGWPGYVHVGGDIDQPFLDVIKLKGRTSGEFNLETAKFNFTQDITACIEDWVCRGSHTVISSHGVGACATIDLGILGSISIGGGVTFNPVDVDISPVGCRWSHFEEKVFPGGRAAQAGGSFTVTIKPGDPSRSLRLDGAAGAPRVRVTAPDGQVLDSPAGADQALTPALRILRSERIKATFVGLSDPKPGTYEIDLMPGSPTITKVSEADEPPPAHVSARVSGRGSERTLVYDVLRRPDQRVTFVEVGPAGKRPLGTITGGGRGTLRFTPAPGTGRRTIEAQFELLGIGAETQTVAAFTPPSAYLGRPTHLTARRRAGGLRVTWTRVADAASYELVTTLTSGEQRITRTRRPNATVGRVTASSGGTVTVRAIAPMRQGRAAKARFRATAAHKATRFGPLPR